jgi:predicted DNA-binding transcriptional regulator AlpA
MTSRPPRLEWVPPLFVGVAAAIAAEVALSLLLYGGPGLVRSLTTVLGIQGFAFAAGLWSAPAPGPDLVERVRRRWILGLVAFLVAATYGSAWPFLPVLAEGRLGQALGLVVMGAFPLYAAGAVLGGITSAAVTDEGGRLSGPGAAAAAGAALGFVLTGFMLPRVPMPGTMLVGCLVLLSAAGMMFGSVLGARTEIVVEARRPSRSGEVRVQERHLDAENVAQVELFEGVFRRRAKGVSDAGSGTPWDVWVLRSLMPSPDTPWRIFHVGGGASNAPRTAIREHPLAEVDVAERIAAVIELGREYFDTELVMGSEGRQVVAVGNLDDLIGSVRTTYDLIVVDLDALAPLGGLWGLSRASLWRMFDALSPAGVVALGPHSVDPPPSEVEEWHALKLEARGDGGSVTLFSRSPLHEEITARLDGGSAV